MNNGLLAAPNQQTAAFSGQFLVTLFDNGLSGTHSLKSLTMTE